MTKTIRISSKLFVKLLQYFNDTTLTDNELLELTNQISSELDDKLDKLVQRDLFTRYKTATTEEQREKARQKYLDSVGIHKDFRTDKEISFSSSNCN